MKKVLFVVLALLLVSSAAYALGDCKSCADVNSDVRSTAIGARFCQGLCNLTLGWTEIFFRPGQDPSKAIEGMFKGLGYAVSRTGAGAIELVTCWTPGKQIVSMDSCPVCAYKK